MNFIFETQMSLGTFFLSVPIFLLFLHAQLFAQSEWTDLDREKQTQYFDNELSEFINSAKADTNKLPVIEALEKYKPVIIRCLVQKFETTYPKRSDFWDLSPDAQSDIHSKHAQDWGKECMLSAMSSRTVGMNPFIEMMIESCIESSQKQFNATRNQVKNYCTCIMESYFADNTDLSKISGKNPEEVLEDMKPQIEACGKKYAHELPKDTISSKWNLEQNTQFFKTCKTWKIKISPSEQDKFCACFGIKASHKYPNYADFLKISVDATKIMSLLNEEYIDCMIKSKNATSGRQ